MLFKALFITPDGHDDIVLFEAKEGEDLLSVCRKHCVPESRLIEIALAPKCPACQYGDLSQWKHMQPGGCLSEPAPAPVVKRGKRAAQ